MPKIALTPYQASELLGIILLGTATLGLSMIAVLLLAGFEIRAVMLLAGLGVVATAVFLRFLLLRGNVRLSAILFTTISWVCRAIAAASSGSGIRSVAVCFLLALVLIAGFSISLRASIIMTVANILLGVLLVWQVQTDAFIPEIQGPVTYNDTLYFIFLIPVFLLILLLVWTAQRAFALNIQQVKDAEQAKHEAEIYRIQTVGLEQAVERRTTELQNSLQREILLAIDLRNALDQEVRLRQLQTQVIDVVLHEFRTPLTIIINTLDMLYNYRSTLSPERAETIYARGSDSVFALARMLDETAVVAQTEREPIPVRPLDLTVADLEQLLRTAVGKIASEHAVEIVWQQHGDQLQTLKQDPALLADTLVTLVDNAIKYSQDTPNIQVSCNLEDGYLMLTVCDTGIGIPVSEQASIGALFARGSNARFVPGLGLGLYVARRRIAEAHGTLTINSRGEGQGTTAVISVPTHITTPTQTINDNPSSG